jgi:exodeoxyribonuclease VII small subunit
MPDDNTELSFEEALNQLETIVTELESGGLPLEQALEKFEVAMRLKKQCEDLLAKAEARIEELTEESGNGDEEEEDNGQ